MIFTLSIGSRSDAGRLERSAEVCAMVVDTVDHYQEGLKVFPQEEIILISVIHNSPCRMAMLSNIHNCKPSHDVSSPKYERDHTLVRLSENAILWKLRYINHIIHGSKDHRSQSLFFVPRIPI